MLGKTGAENASQFKTDKCTFKSNNCQKVMVAMVWKCWERLHNLELTSVHQIRYLSKSYGWEWWGRLALRRGLVSLLLSTARTGARYKKKKIKTVYKDKCTKKANKKTGIHYAETTTIYKDRCRYTQYTVHKNRY